MKMEFYLDHLIIYALDHYGNKQYHVYRNDGLRIIDTPTTLKDTKQLIDELIIGVRVRNCQ